MADLVLETPEGVALRFELAGPGPRLLAAAIDALLFLLGFLGAFLTLELAGLDFGLRLLASGAVLLLVLYSFLFPLLLEGCTPGKLWIGIRVRDAQGFAARPAQLFLRALFVPLEAALVVPVPLVWILIAATPRHQRLGDLGAGTLVLRARERRAPPEPVPGLAWSTLETRAFALDPGAARGLAGRDLGFLRELLTRRDLDPGAESGLYRRAAEHYAPRFGLAPRAFTHAEARTFLREAFLLLREVRAGRTVAKPLTSRPADARPSGARSADGAAGPGAPRASGSPPR
jgi:uncharacterized RDD family membrane protein YckC